MNVQQVLDTYLRHIQILNFSSGKNSSFQIGCRLVRPLFTAAVALLLLVSVAACSQPSVEMPSGQTMPDSLPEIETSDRLVPTPEILQDKVEDAFEAIGDEVEDAAEQVMTTVESAIDTFDDLNESAADALDEVVANTEQAIQETAKDLKKSIKKQTEVVKETLEAEDQQAAEDALEKVSENVSNTVIEPTGTVSDVVEAADDLEPSVPENVSNTAIEPTGAVSDVVEAAKEKANTVMEEADAEFEAMYSQVKSREAAVEETFDAVGAES